MNSLETLATLNTQDTERRQKNHPQTHTHTHTHTTQKNEEDEQHAYEPIKKTRVGLRYHMKK